MQVRLRGWRRQGAAPVGSTNAPTGGEVIDLRDESTWVERIERDPAQLAAQRERRRARAAQAEARRELERLRARHWSGERILEEGRLPIEWWEHPDADPYAVLGLVPGTPLDAAAAARRKIAQECHPDRTADDVEVADQALRRMIAANAAYDRLRRALRAV